MGVGVEGAEGQAGQLAVAAYGQHHGVAVAHGDDHGRQSDDDGGGLHQWAAEKSKGTP